MDDGCSSSLSTLLRCSTSTQLKVPPVSPRLSVTSYMSWKVFILRPMTSTKSSTSRKSCLMFGPSWETQKSHKKETREQREEPRISQHTHLYCQLQDVIGYRPAAVAGLDGGVQVCVCVCVCVCFVSVFSGLFVLSRF